MVRKTAKNLTPEERAIVERARKEFAKPGTPVTAHQAAKMASEQELNSATTQRQQAKAKMVREANKDQPA